MGEFKRQLSVRHIRFLALGSAIGTGLFYGSASAVQMAGPSVILAYLIGGAAVYMVMRCLGEMLVHQPIAGGFAQYVGQYVSPLMGFLTGWTYVLEVIVVCLADATAFGLYMAHWFPDVEQWLWVSGLVIALGCLNLLNAKIFGEMEFWLSLIKVLAIGGMIIGGAVIIILGLEIQGQPGGFQNLWKYGGFMPNGLSGLAISFSVALFAYGGIEIIGVTAREAENPARAIPKAINAVPTRILLFYVLTMVVLLSIYPWSQIGLTGSPFVQIFAKLGIPFAAGLLNIVVITAAISAMNGGLFAIGRVLYSLAEQRHAPRIFMYISNKGVPVMAVIVTTIALGIGIVLNYQLKKEAFLLIASIVTFATIWVWIAILLSQLLMRRRMSKEAISQLAFSVPWWPIAPIIALGFMCFSMGILAYLETTRIALYTGIAWILILTALYYLYGKKMSAGASLQQPDTLIPLKESN